MSQSLTLNQICFHQSNSYSDVARCFATIIFCDLAFFEVEIWSKIRTWWQPLLLASFNRFALFIPSAMTSELQ